MRNFLFTAIPLALLAAAACMAGIPAGDAGQGQGRALATASLNPARAADRQLLAFGEVHPECQLWTNWQKMCSRTGANGEPLCVTDPGRSVPPSEPFCTAPRSALSETPTRAQLGSHRRFCRPGRGTGGDRLRSCEGGEDRPFNGRRLAARMHPWCQLWVDENYRHVCQSGTLNIPNLPRCETLVRRGFVARSKLSCANRSMPGWCRSPALLGDGPQYPYPRDYVGPGYRLGNPTVVGPYCERR